jgi:hypothetical protein
MERLGYERYGAQGGDLGSFICREMGVLAPRPRTETGITPRSS